jgi:hypothetical protein
MKRKLLFSLILSASFIFGTNTFADEYENSYDNIDEFLEIDDNWQPELDEDISKATNITITPIQGSDKYILDDGTGSNEYICDLHGVKLLDTGFEKIENAVGIEKTIYVWIDNKVGLLNSDLELIIPCNFDEVEFVESEGNILIKTSDYETGHVSYYDTEGNRVKLSNSQSVINYIDDECSQWARDGISSAIASKIVPENLQSKYVEKITRKEFCQLAMQTYSIIMKQSIDESVSSPFSDIDDTYVTNAYNLKIVSGTGNGKFSPNNNITRQEAAVMLNNLAKILNIYPKENIIKFIDDSSFSVWSRSSIYSVAGIKTGNVYLMVGTEPNKFSPWLNYTREQAIVTMYRLYSCK